MFFLQNEKNKFHLIYKYCLCLVLLFVFYGHAYAVDSGIQTSKSTSATNISCPSQEFSEFLKAFSENSEIQMAFTKYPLKQQHLDLNAEPEPKPILKNLSRAQIKFPVVPNEAKRKSSSLSFRVEKLASKKATLLLFKEDTDYQILYFFRKDSCWRLERIENWSL